jgi:hypothetical protein
MKERMEERKKKERKNIAIEIALNLQYALNRSGIVIVFIL